MSGLYQGPSLLLDRGRNTLLPMGSRRRVFNPKNSPIRYFAQISSLYV
jgi:hypothetical protein